MLKRAAPSRKDRVAETARVAHRGSQSFWYCETAHGQKFPNQLHPNRDSFCRHHVMRAHRKSAAPKEKPEEAASLLGNKAHDKGSETRVDIQVHAGSQVSLSSCLHGSQTCITSPVTGSQKQQ